MFCSTVLKATLPPYGTLSRIAAKALQAPNKQKN